MTKFIFRIESKNETFSMFRVPEGQIQALDLINRAYINSINPKVWLVSALNMMPVENWAEAKK